MNKKSFVAGLAVGAVAASICVGGYSAYSMINSKAYAINNKMQYIANMLESHYVEDVDYQAMDEGIFKGMVSALGDVYTSYMTEEEFIDLTSDTSGSFFGIGISVPTKESNDGLHIISVFADTPAEEAGIIADDIITKVDGTDILGMDTSSVIKLIKGPEGTKVNLTFYRPSDKTEKNVEVERRNINVISAEGEMMDNSIGYIKITQFNENTFGQFKNVLTDLQSKDMKGLVVDVRDNPGGVLDGVKDITDLLVGEGTMVYTIDKAGNRKDYTSDANKVDVPIAVLINGNSASASEILSGAIQDMDAGVLVGTQSFGKGLVQGIYQLPDKSGIKITIQKYYTPSGVCIQGTGLTPDYKVELENGITNSNLIQREDDTQLKKALEVVGEQIK